MCGLYGFFNTGKREIPSGAVKSAVRDLAIANMSRGEDSTGIVVIDDDANVFSARKTMPAQKFLNKRAVKRFMRETIDSATTVVMGHTRMATCGEVTIQNAMPFEVFNIVGSHNGHINNHEDIMKKHEFTPFTQCDSESIFQLMSKYTGLKQRAKALKELSGYYATVFYDLDTPEKIYFGRSYQTFNLVYCSKYKVYFWCSTKKPLEQIAKKYGFKFRLVEIDSYSLMELNRDNNRKSADTFNYDYFEPKTVASYGLGSYYQDLEDEFVEDEYLLDKLSYMTDSELNDYWHANGEKYWQKNKNWKQAYWDC